MSTCSSEVKLVIYHVSNVCVCVCTREPFLFAHTFPALTCDAPVLLCQGIRHQFDPQVVIVTCWVRWGRQEHRA